MSFISKAIRACCNATAKMHRHGIPVFAFVALFIALVIYYLFVPVISHVELSVEILRDNGMISLHDEVFQFLSQPKKIFDIHPLATAMSDVVTAKDPSSGVQQLAYDIIDELPIYANNTFSIRYSVNSTIQPHQNERINSHTVCCKTDKISFPLLNMDQSFTIASRAATVVVVTDATTITCPRLFAPFTIAQYKQSHSELLQKLKLHMERRNNA